MQRDQLPPPIWVMGSGRDRRAGRTTLRLLVTVGLVLTVVAVPALAHGSDYDSDGLADDEESEYGTEIDNRDTDNDSLIDGVEVYETKTDPTNPDTDGDGFADGEEHRLGSDPTDTEDTPAVWDRIEYGTFLPYLLGGFLAIGGLGLLAVFRRRRSSPATDGT